LKQLKEKADHEEVIIGFGAKEEDQKNSGLILHRNMRRAATSSTQDEVGFTPQDSAQQISRNDVLLQDWFRRRSKPTKDNDRQAPQKSLALTLPP
jgi:hypothetical protein